MGEALDQIARTVAAGGSRREALKKIGGAVAGALLVSLGLGAKPAAANGCRACGSSGAPCCGCCSGTTGSSCQTGTSSSLCGINGNRCVVCPSNTRCNGGACTCCPPDQPDCGIRCATGQPCTANGTCGACTNPTGGFPCNGVCKLLSVATCSSNAQCASGICSTASPRTCIGGTAGASCACDAACAVGTCLSGICGCPAGYVVLDNGTCAHPNDNICSACPGLKCHAPDIDGLHDYCTPCSAPELPGPCGDDRDCPKGYFCQSGGNFCNLAC